MTNTTNLNSPDSPPKCSSPNPGLSFHILRQLQYEYVLAGTPILARLQDFLTAMSYDLGQGNGPATFNQALQELASMSASSRVVILTTAFLAHAKAVRSQLSSIRLVFMAWWLIGAKERLEGTGNQDSISSQVFKAFANDQFNQAAGEPKAKLDGTIRDATIFLASLKAVLKPSSDAYKLGRKQIHNSQTDSTIPNSAVSGDAPTTLGGHTAAPGAFDSMCQVSGDQGQPRPAGTEDDLTDARAKGQTAAGVQDGTMDKTTSECPLPPPVEGSLSRADLPMPKQEVAEPISKANPAPVKHRPGTPVPVTFNMNLNAPGRVPGKDLRSGRSRVQLTAQADMAENGVYRFMGSDQPLVRIDEGAKASSTSKKPATKATEPLVRADAIIPDIIMSTEDISAEPDDQVDGSPSETASAFSEPADAESQVAAPSIAAGLADERRDENEDYAPPTRNLPQDESENPSTVTKSSADGDHQWDRN